MLKCPIWGKTNILWKNSNWLWSECILVEEVVAGYAGGVDASKIYVEEETYWLKDHEKKKRFIRLICKCKGETFDETKEIKNIKIKVEDVKLVVKSVLGMELNIITK